MPKREKNERRDFFFPKTEEVQPIAFLFLCRTIRANKQKKSMAYFSLLDSGPNFLLGSLGENKARRSVFLFHNHTSSRSL